MKATLFIPLLSLILFVSNPALAINPGFADFCRQHLGSAYWKAKMGEAVAEDSEIEWVDDATKLDQVKNVLVNSFVGDPLLKWFHPDPKVHNRLLGTFVNHAFMNGAILQIKGGQTAAALWFESARAQVKPFNLVLTGQAALVPKFGLRTIDLLKFDNFAVKTRNELAASCTGATGKPLYLFYLGVVPEEQGRYYPLKLIRPILKFADAEQRAVVLEVQKDSNRKLAEHLDFGGNVTWTVPADAPETTTMVRCPKPLKTE